MASKIPTDTPLGTDAIAWQNQRGNSYSASPVLHDGTLYVLTDSGMLSAYEAKTVRAGVEAALRAHYAFDARTDAVADVSNSETAAAGTTHEGLYVLA